MTFLNEAKRISSQFFRATKSLASDAVIELTYQYHFAVLRQIGKTYALEEEAEKLTERIKDNDDRGCNFSSPSDWLEEQLATPSPVDTYFRVVAKDTQGNSESSPVNKIENGVVTTISNPIIVWDSGFFDTQWSVGVVLVKEGDSYRILDYIRDKLEIIGQLQEIRNFASKYPEAKIGIIPQANGAAILRLLQSEFPNIVEAKLALGDRTKVEQAIMERKLLTVPSSFNEFDEWKRIVNWGISYLAIDSLTNVDLADLKEGDRLTNRWGNAPEFETEAETDAFKFVEMKQNISDDGLNEPDYPYDTEPSA